MEYMDNGSAIQSWGNMSLRMFRVMFQCRNVQTCLNDIVKRIRLILSWYFEAHFTIIIAENKNISSLALR